MAEHAYEKPNVKESMAESVWKLNMSSYNQTYIESGPNS